MPVEGNAGSGNTDVGSPVKVGGRYNTSLPTLTNGQRGDLQLTSKGELIASLAGGGFAVDARNANADSVSATVYALVTEALGHVFNGTSWDRLRTPNVFKTLSAVVITSETTIWTPAGGKKFRLMGFCLAQGVVTGAVTLKDNTAGSTILIIPQNTIGVYMVSPPMGNGILSGAADRVLTATGASTETLTGFVFGTEE